MSPDMTTSIITAELLKVDLSRHSPSMAQYLGMTFSPNAGKASEAPLLASVPSWSPSWARQVQP